MPGSIVVAATLLAWTGGLLVVSTTIGIVVGLAVAAGGGTVLGPPDAARPSRRPGRRIHPGRRWASTGPLSGMYLGPLDYLAQVYGLIVPLQVALAAAGALAGSGALASSR